MNYYVGVDLADRKHDICILDSTGEKLKEFTVPHSPEGLDQLITEIHELSTDIHNVFISAETYKHLFMESLHAIGYTMYSINPKSVDRARDRFSPAGAKDDSRDAQVLADLIRTDQHQYRPLRKDSSELKELQLLVRDRESLVALKVRIENQIMACLKSYYPQALECFCKLDQQSTITFLKAFPTPTEFASADLDHLEHILKECYNFNWKSKAKELFLLGQQKQFQVNSATAQAKSRLLLSLLNQLELLIQDIKAYDKAIGCLVKSHPDSEIFLSLKGVGTNLAARLMVEFGDDHSYYPHANALQCEAGTAPVTRKSGKRRLVHFRRACKKTFRNTMQQFALQMVKHEPWSKEMFKKHRKLGRGTSESMRIVANTWLRILFAMWKNHQHYDRAIYLETKARNAA
ncbi:IS110 family RNA-guided transposase [Bacillus paralicheniformis]|uniref:IS110 family transposase n=1 Tax=Bacillus paralicheniformis TaxID=1648923 RepID=UPI002DBD4C07|nr:IS110 family transposase [Bacillus paralicheniformis]MEC1024129.1 IS110 family transposase [Bacillus paralicheniformis]MEC1028082.1 IS110 family transposase [Bacillus paralicheniformis]MEC1037186.1 IS110 family transposase [Bacillus paralicheniformis]MEC1053560.1 IS110 family transposase [Bacillus paralicheniformis]MEC1062159.1 IS110 family transposase [Bacillus paralicheniformis]